jgi:hypothetical protein
MLPIVNPTTPKLRGGLAIRHKPLLDAYKAGGIGLGLLPIAMAVAALLIP